VKEMAYLVIDSRYFVVAEQPTCGVPRTWFGRGGIGFKETTLPLNLARQQQMPSSAATSFPSHLTH
jgi:hypothetical protein